MKNKTHDALTNAHRRRETEAARRRDLKEEDMRRHPDRYPEA